LNQPGSFLRSCLSLTAPVGRLTYCLSGFSLAAIKYLGDVALIAHATGRLWKPTDYLALTHSLFYSNLKGAPSWLLPALGLWVLPFLWIGVILTLRRGVDAGWSPWSALLSGGRTRLEGSTWYEIEMAPEAYWQLWSDFLIHRIHNRVLDHIKTEVQGSP
jgi:hypothetical protein